MSVTKVLDLSNIPSSISSSYFQNQTQKLENLPNFMDSYGYIDKFCRKTLLQNKNFLDGVSNLIKNSISLDADSKCFVMPEDKELKAEATKIGLDIVLEKNAEVLKVLQEASEIYNEYHESFIEKIVINHLHHFDVRYEVLNLYFSLLYQFGAKSSQKALEYIYISSDFDMIRILNSKTLKYEDFCYMFIDSDIRLHNNATVKLADLKTLPERYKAIRELD